MSRTLYVCASCTAEYTRRSSANRHNTHSHKGRGNIVRLLDYVIGVVTGRYRQPDPSLHPRGGKKRTFAASFPIGHRSGENNRINQTDPLAGCDEVLEAGEKVLKIKKCLGRILSPREAHETAKMCFYTYVPTHDMAGLDRELAKVQRIVRSQELLGELRYSGSDIPYSKTDYSNLHFSHSLPTSKNVGDHNTDTMERFIKDSIEWLKNFREKGKTTSSGQPATPPASFATRPSDDADHTPSFLELMGLQEANVSSPEFHRVAHPGGKQSDESVAYFNSAAATSSWVSENRTRAPTMSPVRELKASSDAASLRDDLLGFYRSSSSASRRRLRHRKSNGSELHSDTSLSSTQK